MSPIVTAPQKYRVSLEDVAQLIRPICIHSKLVLGELGCYNQQTSASLVLDQIQFGILPAQMIVLAFRVPMHADLVLPSTQAETSCQHVCNV